MKRSDFRHWVSVPTRYRDLDPMGHVNSSVYFSYFESGRTSYLEAAGVSAMRVPEKWGIPVVSQSCNYRQQVWHPSALDVGVRCAELREKTVHLQYAIFLADTDTLVADGMSVSVWTDLTIPKAVPMPDDLREAIETYEGHAVAD